MAREELKWQNIDADDLPAAVKKSFDAMVEAEAAFKADLENLLKAEGHMPEDKFLVMSRKGKRLGVAFASTPRREGGAGFLKFKTKMSGSRSSSPRLRSAPFSIDGRAATDAVFARLDQMPAAYHPGLVQVVLPHIFRDRYEDEEPPFRNLPVNSLERLIRLAFQTIRRATTPSCASQIFPTLR